MSTHFRPYAPDQPALLPACPQDWLPEDPLAYQIRDLGKALDLSKIYAAYNNETRGAPAFDPLMMVLLLLYSWTNKVYSSRSTAKLCIGDLGGRYLCAGHQPDFRTLNAFRNRHGDALADLFVQSVRLCQRAGMVSLDHVAIDGTKLAANASKHKAMSYGRMDSTEEQLRAEIAEIRKRCADEDAREDTLFGKENAGYDLPEELKFRESRLARILEAKAALEAEARAAAEAKAAERAQQANDSDGDPPKKRKRRKAEDPESAVPKDTAQRNFTDPESRIMKSGTGEWVQGYNGLAAADGDHQVVVACDLTNCAADAAQFLPMVHQVEENTGAHPPNLSADAGFFSKANVEASDDSFGQTLIPPKRIPHGRAFDLSASEAPSACDASDDADTTPAERMRKLLSTPEGRAGYARRKKTIEPVFGQIKGCAGSPGFRGFMRRGLVKARQEWRWVCATHNFLKYMRYINGKGVSSMAA